MASFARDPLTFRAIGRARGSTRAKGDMLATSMEGPGKDRRMLEVIFLVEEAPEGGFTARALGHSIFTEADDVVDLHAKIRDAVRCHFDEGQVPKLIRLHFVREDVIIA